MGMMSYSINPHFTALLAFCIFIFVTIRSGVNLLPPQKLLITAINNHHVTKSNGHFSKLILISQQHFLPFQHTPLLPQLLWCYIYVFLLPHWPLPLSLLYCPSFSSQILMLACLKDSQTQNPKGKGRQHKERRRTEHLQARPQSLQLLAFMCEWRFIVPLSWLFKGKKNPDFYVKFLNF